jgi:hypothetical protein
MSLNKEVILSNTLASEYVVMTSDEPLEFDDEEEINESFTEMVREALDSYGYAKLKAFSYFDLQGICGEDARWTLFKSSGPKKEIFEGYQKARASLLKKELDKQKSLKAARRKAVEDIVYAGALINQSKGCDMVQRCVNMGIHPNETPPPGPRKSKNGKTAAYVAAKHGHLRTLELLVKLGADVDKAKDNGCTPVYVAAEHNQPEAIALLARLGADLTKSKPADGFFPMLIATQFGNLECIVALHSAGADVHQKNVSGQSCLVMAIQKENQQIERFLRQNGASLGTEDMDLHTTEDILAWLRELGLLQAMFPVFTHNLRTWEVTAAQLFGAEDPEALAELLHPDLNESWQNAFFRIVQYQSALQRTRALNEELKVAAAAAAAAAAEAEAEAEAAAAAAAEA